MLVDLGDAVADEVGVPFEQISLEMLYRGLYHFSVAANQGKASNLVAYFAASENQDLRVIKIRKPDTPLDLSPFPKSRLTFAWSEARLLYSLKSQHSDNLRTWHPVQSLRDRRVAIPAAR